MTERLQPLTVRGAANRLKWRVPMTCYVVAALWLSPICWAADETVSLSATDMPITEACAELQRQTGIAVSCSAPVERRVTARLTDVPLELMLSVICEACDCVWEKTEEGYSVRPRKEGPAQPPSPADQQGTVPWRKVLDDMEGPKRWFGGKVSEEFAASGTRAVKWHNMPAQTKLTCSLDPTEHDWSGFDTVEFWAYSETANYAQIALLLSSNNPATAKQDRFLSRFRVDWEGWKRFSVPQWAFHVLEEPAGWEHIESITFSAVGWECVPYADTALWIDDFALVALPPEAKTGRLIIGHMDYDIDLWQGLAWDDTIAHEGEASGRWETDRVAYVRSTAIPHDWSEVESLQMWVRANTPNDARFKILAYSNDPDTPETDVYCATFHVRSTEWVHLSFPVWRLEPAHRPVGWHYVQNLTIAASGWGLEAEPGVALYLDEIALQRKSAETGDTAEQVLVFADFEAGTSVWAGTVPERQNVHGGSQAARWRVTEENSFLRSTVIPRDWSGYDRLSFWLHSETANGSHLKVLLYSNDLATAKIDCYVYEFQVDWTGWRQVRVPKRYFQAVGSPLGWTRIENITIAAGGWGLQVVPGTVLCIDDMALESASAEGDVLISDMEADCHHWRGALPDTDLARSGQTSARWVVRDETPHIFNIHIPHDWRDFTALRFWLYSSIPQPTTLKVVLYSDNPQTEKIDCYVFPLSVDWDGWAEVNLLRQVFQVAYSPLGWDHIDRIMLVGQGFGLPGDPERQWNLDDVELVRAETH